MLILVLDASGVGALVACVRDGSVLALRQTDAVRGVAALLPAMMQAVLAETEPPDLVGVVRGPGSFTGIRAALALAQGYGQAAAIPVVGVTVTAALAAGAVLPPGRTVWTAVDSRRGRVFLDRGAGPVTTALDMLPQPDAPIAVAGDAAPVVAAALVARGADVLLLSMRRPTPAGVAWAAMQQAASQPHRVQPLYVDAPEARPIAPPRPAPLA